MSAQPISRARTFSEFKENHVIDTFRETRPSDGIKPSEGTDIFDRVVGGELPQVVVSTRDLRLRIERSYGFLADKTVHEDELEATKHPRPELQSTYVAPRNETENRLTGVWETLLGVERVGIDDDFFELGGDSLLATQFVARVERIFDLKLPIGSLFERPTIAKLAEQVDTIRWAKQGRSSSVGTTTTKREQIIL